MFLLPDGVYTCKSVTSIKELNSDTHLMEIEFENGVSAFMFGKYVDTLNFIGREVIVEFREEIIEGKMETCINNLLLTSIVRTLEKEEDIKLYIDDIPENDSNVNIREIELNDIRLNCIVYCQGHSYESSKIANWANLRIVDKNRNTATVKLFDPEQQSSNFVGHYIRLDIKKTKFGLQTTKAAIEPGFKMSINPEVDIAKKYIFKAVANDAALKEYVDKSGILVKMENYIDEDTPEIGYLLVETALELECIRAIKNMSPAADTELLTRMAIMKKAYCFTHNDNQTLSKRLQALFAVSPYKIATTKRALSTLDPGCEVEYLDLELLNQVEKIAKTLIEGRKTLRYVLSTDRIWGSK